MRPVANEIGHTYGRLRVVAKGDPTPNGRVRWLCLCDCGRTVLVIGTNLRTGNTRSCGCRGHGGRKAIEA